MATAVTTTAVMGAAVAVGAAGVAAAMIETAVVGVAAAGATTGTTAGGARVASTVTPQRGRRGGRTTPLLAAEVVAGMSAVGTAGMSVAAASVVGARRRPCPRQSSTVSWSPCRRSTLLAAIVQRCACGCMCGCVPRREAVRDRVH